MKNLSNVFQSMFVTLTLSTAFGVFLHDTKVDTATSLITQGVNHASDKAPSFSSDPHIHHERASFATSHMQRDTTPRVQPRFDDRKYISQKKLSNKHHDFNAWHLAVAGTA